MEKIREIYSKYQELNLHRCMSCTECSLHIEAERQVTWRGNYSLPIVLMGDYPGTDDDISGVPFVGLEGVLLERALNSVGWSSQDCYVTVAEKCRPESSRKPKISEMRHCASQHFWTELQTIVREVEHPALIIAFGLLAGKMLTSVKNLTESRTTIYNVRIPKKHLLIGIKEVATFNVLITDHPRTLLRYMDLSSNSRRYAFWKDMIRARNFVDANLEF